MGVFSCFGVGDNATSDAASESCCLNLLTKCLTLFCWGGTRARPSTRRYQSVTASNSEVVPNNASLRCPSVHQEVEIGKEYSATEKHSLTFDVKPGYSDPLSNNNEDECPTCLEEYTPENPKIITKCSHHYHLSCILEWQKRSETCPFCAALMEFETN